MPKAVDKVPSMPLAPRLKKGRIPVLLGFQKNSTSRAGILLAINSGVVGGRIWESNQAALPSNSWFIVLISRSTADLTLASASHHCCKYERFCILDFGFWIGTILPISPSAHLPICSTDIRRCVVFPWRGSRLWWLGSIIHRRGWHSSNQVRSSLLIGSSPR